MQLQLQQRLENLRNEFEAGQVKLNDLERQQSFVRETLLRISGAIQVLEELLKETKSRELWEGGEETHSCELHEASS